MSNTINTTTPTYAVTEDSPLVRELKRKVKALRREIEDLEVLIDDEKFCPTEGGGK